MKLALAVALALIMAGCGAASDTAPPTSDSPASPPLLPEQVPSGEPPEAPTAGPPPAWVGTDSGAHWLGFSTYCWGGACADYVAPSCGASHVPTLVLHRGETIDLSLEFEPESLSLSYVDDEASVQLPTDAPSWTADRAGVFSVFAQAEEGDASYVGCIRFDG